MRVLLVFPPLSIPSQPYLSLPSLTAFLRKNGVSVVQKDINIEFYDDILTGSRLKTVFQKIQKKHEGLESNKELSHEDYDRYVKLSQALLVAPYVIDNIDNSKKWLRTLKGYKDLKRYSQSSQVIKRSLSLLSAQYYPSEFGFTYYHSKYSDCSVSEIMVAIKDEETNIFLSYYRERAIPFILDNNFDVIGISIPYFYQIIPGLTLARLIKKRNNKAHIVIGGSAFTEHIDTLKKNKKLFSFIDSFVVFEGETAFLKLVQCIQKGVGFGEIPNLIYKDISGHIIVNKLHFTEDVNSLPTPDFDDLPLHLYFSPKPVLPLATSRGCYWGKCSFCTHDTIYNNNYRSRKVNLVQDDILYLSKKYSTNYFEFVDSTMSTKKVKDLSSILHKDGSSVEWFCYARAEEEYTSESFVESISKGGCKMLMFGIESTSQRILDLMKKGTKTENLPRILKNCHKYSIDASLFFMLGFPTETPEEAEETFRFVMEHKDHIDGYICIFTFGLVKHSKIALFPDEYGLTILRDRKEDLTRIYDSKVSTGMDTKKAQEVQMFLRDKYKRIDEYMDKISSTLLWRGHCLVLDRSFYGFSEFKSPVQDNVDLKSGSYGEDIPFSLPNNIYKKTFKYDITQFENTKYLDTAPSILKLLEKKGLRKRSEVIPKKTCTLFDSESNRFLKVNSHLNFILRLSDSGISVKEAINRLAKEYQLPVKDAYKEVSFLFQHPFLGKTTQDDNAYKPSDGCI